MKRRALLFAATATLALLTVAFVTYSPSSSAAPADTTAAPRIRPLPPLREQAR